MVITCIILHIIRRIYNIGKYEPVKVDAFVRLDTSLL